LGLYLIATFIFLIGFLFLLVLNNATTGYTILGGGIATFALLQAQGNRWISVDPAKSAEARFFARIRSNVSILLGAIAVSLGIVFPNAYPGYGKDYPFFVVAVLTLLIGVLT
jgi:hypothetical protein